MLSHGNTRRHEQEETSALTVLLHNLQELHHDLRAWPDEHLSLPSLLSVSDGLEGVGEYAHSHHLFHRASERGREQDEAEGRRCGV